MRRSAGVLGLVIAALLPSTGCFSKNVPEPTRYFRPALEEALEARVGGPPPGPAPAPISLRLRRVASSAHLRERFATRVSDVEVGFDDLLRWTEVPSVYLERVLASELFERRFMTRTESGAAARLEVELRAFEEVRHEGAPFALVEVRVSLSDAKDVSLLEQSFFARRPLEKRGPEALARATGAALSEAVKGAAAAIEREVRKAR